MRRIVPALALAAAACSEATLPVRPDPYGFSIDCGRDGVGCAAGAGDIRLIFRWPRRSLPVRIWAETADLRVHAANGIRTWMDAGLYSEFAGGLVGDSLFADVLIRVGAPETIVRVDDAPLDCRGNTPLTITSADTTMALPFHITVHPRIGASPADIDGCFTIVVMHELGHALGLFQHSTEPDDLMYFSPRVSVLSPRDRATFNTLYHIEPTVRVPAGR
ncbi:MAG TPA: matrixin family metalloprotease [Gemmatimonadales bacterium]